MSITVPNALILAGGKSTRLGQDKVGLHWSGSIMLRRMMNLATPFCDQVFVSGRNPDQHKIDAPWIPDQYTGIGPIGGIISGLRTLGTPLLVLACDLPLLDSESLTLLLGENARRPKEKVMTTFLQKETGFIESLIAVYQPSALEWLEESAENGIYKLSRAIPPEKRHHIEYSAAESNTFFNINYPKDLEKLRDIERQKLARIAQEHL